MISFELLAITVLVILAFGDLIVGVINDAVNFLNSAIGAKVATPKTIMLVASLGVIIGATFSDGIIEVARKGIFYPEFFEGNEAIILFTAVALADIVLLDLYSTFGLPTSTTVSIVFELLGAAFVMAWWKMGGFTEAWTVINGESATKIIVGILLSVVIAFTVGAIAQFITRLIFTFDYKERFRRWGFLWSGVALTALTFFILFKGAKHATFMTDDVKAWVASNISSLLLILLVVFSVISWALIRANKNILKLIVLIGTASLAMAFAGNDLANFIGVSVAGMHAFLGADLSGTLPTPTWVLLLAGGVMSCAMFASSKAKTVTGTSVTLSSHGKHVTKHWKPHFMVEKMANFMTVTFGSFKYLVPKRGRAWLKKRWDSSAYHHNNHNGSDFDLIRASVNLMVAAAVISFATSLKLPLSTTYVTFMVAMGAALADGAWDRECAPYRITGIMTVVGGWFITAVLAFLMAGVTVSALYKAQVYGLVLMTVLVAIIVYKLYHLHKKRTKA